MDGRKISFKTARKLHISLTGTKKLEKGKRKEYIKRGMVKVKEIRCEIIIFIIYIFSLSFLFILVYLI